MAFRMESNAVRELGRAIANGTGFTFPSGLTTTLSSLTDVVITNPHDGDVLTYDLATQKWVNKQPAP